MKKTSLTWGLPDSGFPDLGLLEDRVHLLRVQVVRGVPEHREEGAQRRVQDDAVEGRTKKHQRTENGCTQKIR